MARAAANMASEISDPSELVHFLSRGQQAADPSMTIAGFKRMAALAPDPSPESQAAMTKFVASGGVAAVIAAMSSHREHTSVGGDAVLELELCEVQEQGCVLLMNLAGAALAGDAACARALVDARAASVVVQAIERYPESIAADLGEAGVAALMQLSILDLPSSLCAASVVLRAMRSPHARGWLLFLCARTLSWMVTTGGDAAQQSLKDAGALDALLDGLRRARVCDPECGVAFGLPDALDQLQVVARHTLAVLSAASASDGSAASAAMAANGSGGGGADDEYGLHDGVLKVAQPPGPEPPPISPTTAAACVLVLVLVLVRVCIIICVCVCAFGSSLP